MRPFVRIELPDSGVLLLPASLDRRDCDLHGAPAVRVQVIVPGSGGEEQQRFPEGVELELLIDPVADDVAAAGIPGQIELPLIGDAATARRVSGLQPRAVLEQTLTDEADGVVEQRVGASLCDRLPRVALVANPDVAVVVVAAPSGTLG